MSLANDLKKRSMIGTKPSSAKKSSSSKSYLKTEVLSSGHLRGYANSTMAVTYGLQKLEGNAKAYFTCTCAILVRGRDVAGGAMHTEILKVSKRFNNIIALHLSDEDGVPMHALENGYYYCQHPKEFSDEVIVRHFRIPMGWIGNLRELSKPELAAWVEQQKPRWKKEAKQVIKEYALKKA